MAVITAPEVPCATRRRREQMGSAREIISDKREDWTLITHILYMPSKKGCRLATLLLLWYDVYQYQLQNHRVRIDLS